MVLHSNPNQPVVSDAAATTHCAQSQQRYNFPVAIGPSVFNNFNDHSNFNDYTNYSGDAIKNHGNNDHPNYNNHSDIYGDSRDAGQNKFFHLNTHDTIQNNLPIADPFTTATTFGLNPHASANNNNQNMLAGNDGSASDEDHGNDRRGDDAEYSDEPDGDGLLKGGI